MSLLLLLVPIRGDGFSVASNANAQHWTWQTVGSQAALDKHRSSLGCSRPDAGQAGSERGRPAVSHDAHPVWRIVLQPLGGVEWPGEGTKGFKFLHVEV